MIRVRLLSLAFAGLFGCAATPTSSPSWDVGDAAPSPASRQSTPREPAPTDTPPLAPALAPTPTTVAPQAAPELERYDNIYRRATLRVGGVLFGSFGTTARVSSDIGVGAILDFEDLLGIDRSDQVFRLDGSYAFNDRHSVVVGYYDIDRSGSETLTEGIEVGDVVIPAGDVRSSFGTKIFKLSYRYNFVTDARTVIGASFGAHTMRLNLGLESGAFDIEESFGATVPVPLVGLHAAYALSPTWSLYSTGEALQVSIDDYGGTIIDFRLGLNWDAFEHVGLGVEFNSFRMDIDAEDGNLDAEVRYAYQGIGAFLRVYL